MKLYVTLTSPYARLARIVVIEKGLADRVETLGGTLTVVSPPEGGTRLVAVIPTGSRPESAETDQARWSA